MIEISGYDSLNSAGCRCAEAMCSVSRADHCSAFQSESPSALLSEIGNPFSWTRFLASRRGDLEEDKLLPLGMRADQDTIRILINVTFWRYLAFFNISNQFEFYAPLGSHFTGSLRNLTTDILLIKIDVNTHIYYYFFNHFIFLVLNCCLDKDIQFNFRKTWTYQLSFKPTKARLEYESNGFLKLIIYRLYDIDK